MSIKDEFEAVTADIEKYLGILKGNETAWEWREGYKADNFSHYGAPYGPIPPTFQTSPPGGEYTVFFQDLLLPDEAFVDGQHKVDFGRQINERCATSFDNGVTWASGIADYLNSLCADLIRPDAAALQESVQLFHDSMIETQSALPVGWTDEMTAMLQDAYLTPLQDGMHNLQGEKSSAIAAAQDGITPWLPEPLAGVGDESWRHEQEHV